MGILPKTLKTAVTRSKPPTAVFNLGKRKDLLFGFYLVLGADTTGTKVKLLCFSINRNGGRVDVRVEAAVGMSFRMADVGTEHGYFSTNITFQGVYS